MKINVHHLWTLRPVSLKRGGWLLLFCLLWGWPAVPSQAAPKGMLQGSHGQRQALPKGCRSCHLGMNMALSGEETSCLPCHGSDDARREAVGSGRLKMSQGAVLADITEDLQKPYSHPTLSVRGVHRQFEALPEEVANASRHAECVDCHNPHLAEKGSPYRGLKGRRVGNLAAGIEREYQLCYRCHSESVNLPGTSTDKHQEFKVSNPSYHPVEGEGKSTYVISLKEPYAAKKERPGDISIISCSDCHGSDDPTGPQGPHGSRYAGLLKYNYEMDDGRPEGPLAYELCYQCHDRTSILNNESFPYHALHIQGGLGGQGGTSCFTCHDAHGSPSNQHLIRFNEEVVLENKDGRLDYDAKGYAARHGACYLNCHGVEHAPKEY